ncbi:hypothetical protein GCM10027046_35330 [Uliginosibacterium flavum]
MMNRPYHECSPLKRLVRLGVCLAIAWSLSGCAAVALSLVGAGAGAGINHQVSGVASRTFSEPLPKLKRASLMAAKRMSFVFETTDAIDNGQLMKGRVADMNIAVELEVLSNSVTRVSVSARKNLLFLDGATAQEVVAQIEKALVANELADAAADAAMAALAAAEAEESRSKPARLVMGNERAKSKPRAKGSGSI